MSDGNENTPNSDAADETPNADAADKIAKLTVQDIIAYLENSRIPLPSRDRLVKALLDSGDFSGNAARAAVIAELRNTRQSIEKSIANDVDKLRNEFDRQSDEFNRQLGSVTTQRWVVSVFAVLLSLIGLMGIYSVSSQVSLSKDIDRAEVAMDRMNTASRAYREFLAQSVEEDLYLISESLSTRWLTYSDNPEFFNHMVDRNLSVLSGLQAISFVPTDEVARLLGPNDEVAKLVSSMKEQFDAWKFTLDSLRLNKGAPISPNVLADLERRWTSIHESLTASTWNDHAPMHHRFLAYVENVLGVIAYDRHRNEVKSSERKLPDEPYLLTSKKDFEAARQNYPTFGAAEVNLAVVKLEEIEAKMMLREHPTPGELKTFATDIEGNDGPKMLLTRASSESDQEPRNLARIYNNLANAYLTLAVFAKDAGAEPDAKRFSEIASGNLNTSESITQLPVAAATRAELQAADAYIAGKDNVERVIGSIAEASRRKWPWGIENEKQLADESRAFAKYMETFGPQVKGRILEAVMAR